MSITKPSDAAEVIRLWPDGPPDPIDGVPAEVEYPVRAGIAIGGTALRNVSDPAMTVFAPRADKANGIGVIVVPGGGWSVNMWCHEGLDVARWLAGAGCTAFVLKYRVMATEPDQAAFETAAAAVDSIHLVTPPTAHLPSAIGDLFGLAGVEEHIAHTPYVAARNAAAVDGRRAIELVRELAPKYGLRPEAIGMIGFSAGAFLAVDVAVDPQAEPLAFIAPIYGGETCGKPVPADAPPLFTAVARDDILRKIVEGVYLDWSAADRPCELHVFARGAHGFGMVCQGLPSDGWTDLFLGWLQDLPLEKR